MSPPKLWLHAGAHKTGTTAIQQFAAANRATLLGSGLWYPDFQPVRDDAPTSHNPLAHSLAQPGGSRGLSAVQIRELVDYWREKAGNRSLLVSAEAFCRHLDPEGGKEWLEQRKAYLKRLAAVFADFDVEVIFALRRQDRWAHSVYLENIMKGSDRAKMSFPEFRKFLEKRHLRFEDNIAVFEESFGPVRVLTYEGLSQDGNLFSNFFAELGLKNLKNLVDPGLVRPSLSIRQARMKKLLVPVIVSRSQNRRLNRVLGWQPLIKASKWLWGEPENGFWESENVRREWLEKFEAENERLRLNHFPNRLDLFSPMPSEF